MIAPITSERLVLRPHQPQDREAFIQLVTDPRFATYLTIPEEQQDAAGAAMVFDTIMASYVGDEPIVGLTVSDKETDAFWGTVALHPAPFGEHLELFFAIVPERWGKGLATEAVKALLAAHPARDIVALTDPENVASIAVAKAAGMDDAGLYQALGGPSRHRFVRKAQKA